MCNSIDNCNNHVGLGAVDEYGAGCKNFKEDVIHENVTDPDNNKPDSNNGNPNDMLNFFMVHLVCIWICLLTYLDPFEILSSINAL